MNSFFRPLLSITMFNGLSGERRRAYIKQCLLTAIIFLVLGILTIIVFSTSPDVSEATRDKQKSNLVLFGLILYCLQILYALIKRETLWQLRWRELRSIKESSLETQQELADFAKAQGRKDKSRGGK